MGAKVEALRAKLKAMPDGDDVREVGVTLGHLLGAKKSPSEQLGMADLIMHLRSLKQIVDAASSAVNEELDRRQGELYEWMLANEMQSFSRKGLSFFQTTKTFVKAKDELGGRSNPDLREWLDDADLGGIVKQDINYQTLQGSINEWLSTNPIEVVRDGDFLAGGALLEALGVTAEEFADRQAMHERLRTLVDIGETHTVGTRKA